MVEREREEPVGEPRTRPEGGKGRESGGLASRSDDRFRHVLANLRAMTIAIDPTGRVSYVSDTVTDILGYSPESFIAMAADAWVHPGDQAAYAEFTRELPDIGRPSKAIYRARHADGHWLWLETASAATYTAPGGDVHQVTFTRDISDIKGASDALRDSEERFRAMAENASDLIAEVDGEGRFLFVGPNFTALLGRDSEQLLGQTLRESGFVDHIHESEREIVIKRFEAALASVPGGGQLQFRIRRPDESWIWVESSFSTYRRSDGSVRAVLITRDVTDRVEAQRKLFQSEERYRVLAKTTGDLIFEMDDENRLVYSSPSVREVMGYGPEDLDGAIPIGPVHPEDSERIEKMFQETAAGETLNTGPYRIRRRDGVWRWMWGTGLAYLREDGKQHFFFVARDITVQMQAERERRELERQMQQTQKLEGLGVLAGGIAHDFNNLLTPILGDSSLALMDIPSDSPLRERLVRIQKAAHRAAALTNQMLAYAGTNPLIKEPLSLSQLVGEIGQLLASAASREAQVTYDLPDDLPEIEGDGAQITQVVMNLITNASEAVERSRGLITVRTGMIHSSEVSRAESILAEELPEGLCVYFEVADNGCGMSPETRARIFDPFFTTKFTGRGLGLAAVLGIIRGHRGAIEIDTEAGVGTRFRVLFPQAMAGAVRRDEQPTDLGEWSSVGTMLVVDDDDGVRDLVEDTLARVGFDVLSAADGGEGVELFAKHADRIRAVLLDRTMPNMSGEETFDQLRQIKPDVRVILVSGYSEDRAVADFAGKGLAGFLQKPFLPETLVGKLRSVLGE